jgi:uncharacterized circularly permuted ATP-grasp superfamily protein
MAGASVAEMGSSVPVWSAYPRNEGFFDELVELAKSTNPACSNITRGLLSMPPAKLLELCSRAEIMFRRMGVTFNVYGEERGVERIFPFDPIPRVIDAPTWAELEAGLIQRIRALNAFVADVYGAGAIMNDGVIPRDLVLGCPQFRRSAVGIKPPRGNFVIVGGIDIVRGADGRFMVLEDNVRTPSGVSYVIENRVVMTRLMPDLMRASQVRSVERYPADLLQSLREIAPCAKSNPTIALLTPGPFNSAFFEHVFLTQQMGIELVEGQDLVCMDHKLYMKNVHGLQQIDVLYRRVDDDFLDPLVFRSDSMLGVPGLTAVLRAGNAAIANGIGTGVADDKSIYAYTPAMIRYYLGETPILSIVETHLMRERDQREEVLRHIDRWVIKPVGESGGYGVVIGPHASEQKLEETRARVLANPDNFIAQPVISLSVHPTMITDESGAPKLKPRHVDLRPFVLLGAKPRVLPGGLTRVALREGSLVVNSSQGGGSKDTWVLGA